MLPPPWLRGNCKAGGVSALVKNGVASRGSLGRSRPRVPTGRLCCKDAGGREAFEATSGRTPQVPRVSAGLGGRAKSSGPSGGCEIVLVHLSLQRVLSPLCSHSPHEVDLTPFAVLSFGVHP